MVSMDDIHGNSLDNTPTTYVISVMRQVLEKHKIKERDVTYTELQALMCEAASMVEHDMY